MGASWLVRVGRYIEDSLLMILSHDLVMGKLRRKRGVSLTYCVLCFRNEYSGVVQQAPKIVG
jgi:hypothetical protein